MAQLQLNNIVKRFGPVEVLKQINLNIQDGEFVVFVGPSGCGKSTLLRIIAGLETQTSGEVRIGERDVSDLAPSDRGIAMVFQSYALYPHLSVRGNISLGLKQAKTPQNIIDERVEYAANMLALTDLLERKPAELSGGQRQRVAIGRAIVREPDVFLFDEPLSNLDAALRSSVRHDLAKLHKNLNATMVYVTHDQVEAMTLADRIVVMAGGVIQQVGSPRELYEDPQNRFVAGFIGSPKMNFVPAIDGPNGSEIAADGEMSSFELGLRPEHLSLHDAGHPEGEPGVVQFSEYLGSESFSLVALDKGHQVLVRHSPHEIWNIDQPVKVTQIREGYRFDRDGKRIKGSSE